MSIANFPANLSIAIQQGFLQKRFIDNLQAELGYRYVSEPELFSNNIGETITMTRPGLLAAATTPLNPSTNTNLDNGLSPTAWSVEQFTLAINEYASTIDLNVVNQKVGIADQFLKNASRLGEQARRTLDQLNRDTLFAAYMGGNTRVTTTLGAPATTISVDDITGFTFVIPTSGTSSGKQVPVSGSNPLPVQVGSNVYNLVSYTADLVNTSTAFNGVSGTLTFSSNVSVSDGTAGNAVVSSFAPLIVRPNNRATTADITPSDVLTLDIIREAVTNLRNNAVPTKENGSYVMICSPQSVKELYADPEFQLLYRGTQFQSGAYRNFKLTGSILDVDIITTNIAPIQTLGGVTIQRPIICGREALKEGVFAGMSEIFNDMYGSDNYEAFTEDNIAFVVRGQLDRLKQIIAQSWFFIGGWCAPTDQTIDPTVIPTCTNAYYKRAVVLETA